MPPAADGDDDEGSTEMSETELQEQGEVVKAFLLDLLDAFGLDGEVPRPRADDGAVSWRSPATTWGC